MRTELYNIITQVMDLPSSKVSDESIPDSISTWDSFHGLVLLDELERIFNIKFSFEEFSNIKKAADIKHILQNIYCVFMDDD
jgi:acyl carrier protein